MSGVRIYDLAKELHISNNDVLDVLKSLGEDAKTPSSTVKDDVAEAVRRRTSEDGKTAVAEAAATVSRDAIGNGAAPQSTSPRNGSSSASAAPRPAASAPQPTPNASSGEPAKAVDIPAVIALKDFAQLIGIPAPDIQKKLMGLGVLASLNQKLSPEVTTRLAKSYKVAVNIISADALKTPSVVTPAASGPAAAPPAAPKVAVVAAKPRQKPAGPVSRPPVVTIMGHVDHGKTSLLDAIRKARVADSEFGGITQHIGAYQVEIDDANVSDKKRKITFLDTPGHEAFTSMRARGAQVTDIAILVVAADDGIMPQTIEAISHAKAAQVPMIVALNKIDKEDANPARVLTQLTVQTVEVSAKETLGLEDLLQTILLVADAEVDPKADPSAPGSATVIEAELDKGRGVVATILVDQGTIKMGDSVVAGASYGRIKAMVDDLGQRVKSAEPAKPVVILGLNTVPNAGDRLEVVKNEKEARQLGEERASEMRDEKLVTRRPVTLEDLQRQIKEGDTKELNLIVKGDVQGSVEAVRQSLEKIEHPEVRVRFILTGVGPIGESDVDLAAASQALIVGFNVKADTASMRHAEAEHIEIREYKVIYDLIDEVKKAMAGLLDPIFEEAALGTAEVRAIFKLPKAGGTIAGSYILDGKVVRGASVRIRRGGRVVSEGKIDTLRREKDDAREVAQGYECGILINGYEPVEGDLIDCYEMRRIERTL
jgi:translation initiation factor IF-2